MKHVFLLLTALFLSASSFYAQGPLGPPAGSPTPSMKSLQEIWDKIEILEAQNAEIQQQNAEIQQQLSSPPPPPAPGFPMEFVEVLEAGNAADPLNSGNVPGIGAVAYEYRIGKYEVTNAQYAVFLNAVAATDTYALYDTSMGSDVRGGITRFGAPGGYGYGVKAAMGDKPVIYVNWYDAVRFCNWLHNGRPTGVQDGSTTEGGAYTLTGATGIVAGTDPTHGANGRNTGANFWLPSENEWYKAAYHQSAGQGGDADNYWLYPTQSNATPTVAAAGATGNINNDTTNIANYDILLGADWNGQNSNVTTVGSGGAGSASFYGSFDMGGNVFEWNEKLSGLFRLVRGGSWGSSLRELQSSGNFIGIPPQENNFTGFRVAGP